MSLSKLDKSIATIEFLLKKKQHRVNEVSKKLEQSEREKIFIGDETQMIKSIRHLIDYYKEDVNKHLGRIPPQAVELEESVLGALMLESSNPDHLTKIISFLKPQHFYNSNYSKIYEAILILKEDGSSIDMRSVVVCLRRMGVLDIVGGAYEIARLTALVSSCVDLEYHARVMVEKAINRELILLASQVTAAAYDDKDCFELIEETQEYLDKIKAWIKQ